MDWGARPHWNRHLRVFIKRPISLMTFVTTTDHERRLTLFLFLHCGTMGQDYQNNLCELSVWAHYVTGESCMFLRLVLINRRETFTLLVRRLCQPNYAHENSGNLSGGQSPLLSLIVRTILLTAALRLNYRGTKEGEREGKNREITSGSTQH